MPKRIWKSYRPCNLQEAVEACGDWGLDKHNISVERIAERMGLESKWVIYKWQQSGNIPLNKVLSYQFACGGCTFITDYLAHATHKLVISIPTGRKATAEDINQLQQHLSETVTHLLKFQKSQATEDAQSAIWAITNAMEDLAWQKSNIEKTAQPELDLG